MPRQGSVGGKAIIYRNRLANLSLAAYFVVHKRIKGTFRTNELPRWVIRLAGYSLPETRRRIYKIIDDHGMDKPLQSAKSRDEIHLGENKPIYVPQGESTKDKILNVMQRSKIPLKESEIATGVGMNQVETHLHELISDGSIEKIKGNKFRLVNPE